MKGGSDGSVAIGSASPSNQAHSQHPFVDSTGAVGESRVSQESVMKARKRVELGEYVVADPEICHGQLTFKGTRIMVKSVLFYVGQGKDWDWISEQYFGRVSREAIAEAVKLASEALVEKTESRRRVA
jgi:uncharacterized protein (DUF433 family)